MTETILTVLGAAVLFLLAVGALAAISLLSAALSDVAGSLRDVAEAITDQADALREQPEDVDLYMSGPDESLN